MQAFIAVAQAQGFREGARHSDVSASNLSEAVRRLEERLGVRLFNRTTRSVVPTDAGRLLLARVAPALGELESAIDAVNQFRSRPMGNLRLNVPVSAARLVLPAILPAFMAAYPDIRVEITTEESFVDMIAAGCDAGIRYEERLQPDMIAVPIGPRVQRIATAAAPRYLDLHGRPDHPQQLLQHTCIRGRFASGAIPAWEFERAAEVISIDPLGQLIVQVGGGIDLAVYAAVAGSGVIHLFEDWLRPHLDTGALEPILQPWWQTFSGPFLYYPSRTLIPGPLRALIDFLRDTQDAAPGPAA
ncbi:LysR substrate-binding domain-containing protein [Xanthomonas campestris pv. campestris]|nr:LysR substrate-binding domain-containing protein [Xanthomonas campestris pv. campestris]